MADKNKTSEEDYLDSLLRSITGGTDDKEEEEFLSDFEKEFFGDGEVEELEPAPEKEPTFNELIEKSISSSIESSMETLMELPVNPVEKLPDPIVLPEAETPLVEPINDNIEEFTKVDEIEDLFDLDSDILEAIDEAVISEEAVKDNVAIEDKKTDEKALVEEAINQSDSSVEDDLRGLYDILGMEGDESELPEGIEDKPKKKKKGLFSRFKKNKKKDRDEDIETDTKSSVENSQDMNLTLGKSKGSEEEEIDFEDLFAQAEAADTNNDLGEATSSDGGELGLEFDDSIFDSLDENQELINQMDSGEIDESDLLDSFDEEEDSKGKKKKKDKKEKKEKKKKEKKEKAPKAPKKKKDKVKKAKEPDEVIPIPLIFVIFAVTFIAVIVLVAKLGGDYYSYNQRFHDAISLYVYGNDMEEGEELDVEKYEGKFAKAYNLLRGLEMKEKDHKTFYNQVETIMLMDTHYEAYKRYILIENFDNGLDSLIKAVKMYDKYQNVARELKCFDEMTLVLSWADRELQEVYGITQSDARELYMIKDDNDYAFKVRTIAKEAEEKYKKNNVEEE